MSDVTNGGGPAFPASGRAYTGLTLRDYFAAKALAGILAAAINSLPATAAGNAYDYADAMLQAREAK